MSWLSKIFNNNGDNPIPENHEAVLMNVLEKSRIFLDSEDDEFAQMLDQLCNAVKEAQRGIRIDSLEHKLEEMGIDPSLMHVFEKASIIVDFENDCGGDGALEALEVAVREADRKMGLS